MIVRPPDEGARLEPPVVAGAGSGKQPPLEVLVVDDEPFARAPLVAALRALGHRVTEAADGSAAASLAGQRVFDVVVSDVLLPRMSGLELLRRLRRESPSTAVVLMTARAEVSDAVTALREGAHDYLVKPFDPEDFALTVVRRLAQQRADRAELARARRSLAGHPPGARIIGATPSMARLLERLETMAASDAPVLVTGESGTGKELVARTLHQRGPRRGKPFVAVSCAAFPDTLLEAELFGHERGAFTGAVKRRDGRFKLADGGTILLDEVAEIPLLGQAKLLRVLQEGTFEPLGTNSSQRVNVRVISATHRNLKERVSQGRFREDLYYRLNVLDLHIPPLRERRADIPLLLQHFLGAAPGGAAPMVSARAWAAFLDYPYPGNVRELAHAVEHALVLSQGAEIDLEHLPPDLAGAASAEGAAGGHFPSLTSAIRCFERDYLLRALSVTGGRRERAAELLGICRKTLWEKLRSHGISDDELPG